MWFISTVILIAFLIILMIDNLIKTEQLHAKQGSVAKLKNKCLISILK